MKKYRFFLLLFVLGFIYMGCEENDIDAPPESVLWKFICLFQRFRLRERKCGERVGVEGEFTRISSHGG